MKDYNYDEALYIIHTRSQSIRGINTSLIIHNTLMLELTRMTRRALLDYLRQRFSNS